MSARVTRYEVARVVAVRAARVVCVSAEGECNKRGGGGGVVVKTRSGLAAADGSMAVSAGWAVKCDWANLKRKCTIDDADATRSSVKGEVFRQGEFAKVCGVESVRSKRQKVEFNEFGK